MKLTRALIQELEQTVQLNDHTEDASEIVNDLYDITVKMLQSVENRDDILQLIRYGLRLLHIRDQAAALEARKEQRLFYLVGDSYAVTEKGHTGDHYYWLQGIGMAASYPDMVLGHFDSKNIWIYRYDGMLGHWHLIAMLDKLKILLDEPTYELTPETLVYNRDERLGTLKELLQL